MKLLQPIKVGNLTLKNRIMFPPLTTGYEEKDGTMGEKAIGFYSRLAKGGVGYIVIGDVTPVNTISPTPKLYSDEQIPGIKKLVDECHKYDSKVALQIFHPEYDSETITNMVHEVWALKAQGQKLLASGDTEKGNEVLKDASIKEAASYAKLHHDMVSYVNEVTEKQLDVILDRIKAAVGRAIQAGVDAIEVHGDRLVGSLCSTILNKRSDSYGGSFENRTKFAIKVVDAIREASADICIDYKLPIVVKVNGVVTGKGGLVLKEAIKLAKILEKHGVNMFHVAQANHTGNMNDTIPAMGTRDYAFMLDEVKAVKEAVSVPVSMVGRIITATAGEQLIEKGICDIVAYGRSLLADPDFANKLEQGKGCEIRECIMCNKGCTDAIMHQKFLSCVLNAENGYETERSITKASKKQKVAVVGAGIAGLEAARVLALKGHKVDLYEKSYKLGGQINIASVPPRKEEMIRAINYYENVLKDLPVTIKLNTEANAENLKGYKNIIVAVGAHNLVPHIKGIDGVNVVNAWDVLANKQLCYGHVAVSGGGLVGVETAEYLAERGLKVTIIEMLDGIAKEESSTVLPTLLSSLEKHKVEIRTLSKITEITSDGVKVDLLEPEDKEAAARAKANPRGPQPKINYVKCGEDFINCDVVVNALASVKNEIDLSSLTDANIIYVGDCAGDRPTNVEHAIKSAYDAANSIN